VVGHLVSLSDSMTRAMPSSSATFGPVRRGGVAAWRRGGTFGARPTG